MSGLEDHLVVTNEQVEQQIAMIESTGRQLRFRLTNPNDPGKSLAYAQKFTTA